MSKKSVVIDIKKLDKIKKLIQNDEYVQNAVEKIALALTNKLLSV